MIATHNTAAHHTAGDSYSLKLLRGCIKALGNRLCSSAYIKTLCRIGVNARLTQCSKGLAAQLLLFTKMFNHIYLFL